MNNVMSLDIYEQLPVSSERTFPAAPFPRKYVHCVIDNLRDAVHAVYALRAAGYDARDIQVMACWDFVEAVERAHHQQNGLSKLLSSIISFFDEATVSIATDPPLAEQFTSPRNDKSVIAL